MIISVQGNIGSGKSTLVAAMKQGIKGEQGMELPSWVFVDEPVDDWMKITDADGTDILSLFYQDQEKHAFSFQMMAYISRLDLLKKALYGLPQFVVSERSLEADKEVFEKMLHNDGHISKIEHEIYIKWFDHFASDCSTDKVIYLRCDPTVAYKRVLARNRPGETITLEYLQKCHDAHEMWLSQLPSDKVLILDANQNMTTDDDKFSGRLEWIKQIIHFVAGNDKFSL